MKIIAGLGNPGPKYETTRHNSGFLAVDRLVDAWKAQGPAKSNQGEVYQASVKGERVLLVKPQTFMNVSGKCVAPIFKFYKCSPEDLIVIHDDLDLPAGTLRLKTGGGTGGHNGLKSIDASLGNDLTNYHRIRIGIGRPAPGSPVSAVDYVLQPFSDEELQQLDSVLDKAEEAARKMIEGDVLGAMNEFNTRRT
ncbi:MAG: aminoacyl-tRNA hydrolase [Bdellovibrionales bacterium RIFOXYC1_FULL_54_43]|nr:MAG: aminoacyl-tRNA hydrolase [Bdellovibrionales bacterium RIFOXYC1_FULL_54_43]